MAEAPASGGAAPRRTRFLPYGRQLVDEEDIEAVVAVLRSDWLTTGPQVDAFEQDFAKAVGARHAVAVNSGTAALHAAMTAAEVGPGDEVIVTTLTFAASANAAVYRGGTPVFADVDPDTLLLDPVSVAGHLGPRTKAIVGVDYAGQPCDYDALRELAASAGATLIADACHAIGATDRDRPVGTLADLSTFSLHPVKHITSGEGGMITTEDEAFAQRMRHFRNHGITTDHRQRQTRGAHAYDMVELGFNYRIPDILCALGRSQLGKLEPWVRRRRQIADRYDMAFAEIEGLRPLVTRPGVEPSWHLYVIQLELERLSTDRDTIFQALRDRNIGANVHYRPVHLHPYYRENFGGRPGQCPVAEAAYERIITLPLFPAMSDQDVEDVIRTVEDVLECYR